ncbi:hypothetical protein F0562_001656 [Nyssa sinensis]|uniref:Uncharacterized protein n=1 Tax=Nyssa sinensis TaxID=561372 RepID=A0A5J5C7U0_9ASTE|nr:hypothetical protein F0562_001656 [Nyssa sinensis]
MVRSSDTGLNHLVERPRLPDKAIHQRHLSDARIRDDLTLQMQKVGSRMEGRFRLGQRRGGFNIGPRATQLEPPKPISGLHSRNGTSLMQYKNSSVGLTVGPSRLAQRRRGFNNVSRTAHREPSKPRSGLHSKQGTFTGKKYRAVPIGMQEGSCMLDCGRGFTSGPGKQGATAVGLELQAGPKRRELGLVIARISCNFRTEVSRRCSSRLKEQ